MIIIVKRRGYRRKDGTYVKATTYKIESRGLSRGRKTGKYSIKKGYKPWITREGKLGGKGYLSKSSSVQQRLLDRCVKEYGYRSCLGSIMVLNRSRKLKKKYGAKLDKLKNYLKMKYGGVGSFGKRKTVSRKRSTSMKRKCKYGRKKSGGCKKKPGRKKK